MVCGSPLLLPLYYNTTGFRYLLEPSETTTGHFVAAAIVVLFWSAISFNLDGSMAWTKEEKNYLPGFEDIIGLSPRTRYYRRLPRMIKPNFSKESTSWTAIQNLEIAHQRLRLHCISVTGTIASHGNEATSGIPSISTLKAQRLSRGHGTNF